MSTTPFFTIITPVYNSEQFLAETIRSVETQTFKDYQHLLIDDGSTDQSLSMIEEYVQRDPRARLIRMPKNGGVAGARNEGMRQASGNYVAFLDSDDVWESDKLMAQHQLIQDTGARFIYASYWHMTEEGKLLHVYLCPTQTDYQRLLSGSVIGCLTIAIKRDLLKGREFKNIFHEDYLFWLQLLRDHQITAHGVQKPLARYRLRPNSRSANKKEAARAQWRIYREHLGLSFMQAAPHFISYAFAGIRKHWKKS